MAIWIYENISRRPEHVWVGDVCAFCRQPLQLLHAQSDKISTVKSAGVFEKRLFVCPTCGWWRAEGWQDIDDFVHGEQFRSIHGAAASLRELDLTDLSSPIDEVRSYLAARYDQRFTMHPRLFEETVASVFAGLGYNPVVTAYSGDDGIDVILERGQEKIGVQVKRYRHAIDVEQIRSLAGALVLGDMTRGIFVTTSSFQRGAPSTARALATRGYQIELLDAQRFYDALKLAQRNFYGSFAEFPVRECLNHLVLLEDRVVDPDVLNPPFFRRY